MAFDPCNPVPGNSIPSGLGPARPHHAVHHVVGRIRHRIHHKFVHAGPPAAAPNPSGCEKHAAAGPGYGRAALPVVPSPKVAALVGGGLVGGGLGGLVGGVPPGGGGGKNVITKTSFNPPGVNPVIPVVTPPGTVVVPPIVTPTPPTTITTPTGPGTPPVSVPEPSSVVIFCLAVVVALGARYMLTRGGKLQATA